MDHATLAMVRCRTSDWLDCARITNSWKSSNMSNVLYEAGTWGPGDLILDENESWITKSWRD